MRLIPSHEIDQVAQACTFPFSAYMSWGKRPAQAPIYMVSSNSVQIRPRAVWNSEGREIYDRGRLQAHAEVVFDALEAIIPLRGSRFLVKHCGRQYAWLPEASAGRRLRPEQLKALQDALARILRERPTASQKCTQSHALGLVRLPPDISICVRRQPASKYLISRTFQALVTVVRAISGLGAPLGRCEDGLLVNDGLLWLKTLIDYPYLLRYRDVEFVGVDQPVLIQANHHLSVNVFLTSKTDAERFSDLCQRQGLQTIEVLG